MYCVLHPRSLQAIFSSLSLPFSLSPTPSFSPSPLPPSSLPHLVVLLLHQVQQRVHSSLCQCWEEMIEPSRDGGGGGGGGRGGERRGGEGRGVRRGGGDSGRG